MKFTEHIQSDQRMDSFDFEHNILTCAILKS